jgi:hypothetical protein
MSRILSSLPVLQEKLFRRMASGRVEGMMKGYSRSLRRDGFAGGGSSPAAALCRQKPK